MSTSVEILRCVPDFPNYSSDTFGYPERLVTFNGQSISILGPPIHLYKFQPMKSCTLHISGIPNWATMADVVAVFETFGQIFTIELPVNYQTWKRNEVPLCSGFALVTFVSYDGAQKAMDAHLSRYIPGMKNPLSIYKATVNNVVLLKNLPLKTAKAHILDRITGYPGLLSVSFPKHNVARMVFSDLDYALLFMDIVSGGGLVIDKFTCTVEPEAKGEDSEDDE